MSGYLCVMITPQGEVVHGDTVQEKADRCDGGDRLARAVSEPPCTACDLRADGQVLSWEAEQERLPPDGMKSMKKRNVR